jgi:hypothetical protein
MKIKNAISNFQNLYELGKEFSDDDYFNKTRMLTFNEMNKSPKRTDIINYLVEKFSFKKYLEIGVRNPDDNFNKINCENKFSVDPGLEYEMNPVDFKMTSDEFFKRLRNGELDIPKETKFDLIFIDGLHLADQVDLDIKNSIEYISDNGFIVLHDCNPPSEFHARESYYFKKSPADIYWNGTTWKAFCKHRSNSELSSICIDTDWGIGIFSKKDIFNRLDKNINPYFEFYIFNNRRKEMLNLVSFSEFKNIINKYFKIH